MTQTPAAERFRNAEAVLRAGWFDGPARVSVLGEGRINDTFLVETGGLTETDPGLTDIHGGRDGRRFVLQRINTDVFMDPERLMAQLGRILRHMEMRKPGWLPALVPTRDGALAAREGERGFWRLWRYVESARRSPGKVDVDLAFKAAAAFGTFQRLLNDLPGEALVPTIEGFLELGGYLDRFDRVLGSGNYGVNGLDELVGFVAAHRDLAARFPRGGDYVHGDCKLDNLLFSSDGQEVVAILDLDTVMPGHWAWDFGDLTRSLLAGGGRSPAEGETVDLFRAAVHGFLDARDIRPPPEELLDAPVYVAFMLGVRFLTDHLEGDHYFKVAARGDNLTRANRQFELVKSMEQHRPVLERSVSAVLETLDAGP